MDTYHFDVVLVEEFTEEMANRLFEAGCDDGTPGTCCGVTSVQFSREASSLQEAIQSAVANIVAAGYRPKQVTIDPDALAAIKS